MCVYTSGEIGKEKKESEREREKERERAGDARPKGCEISIESHRRSRVTRFNHRRSRVTPFNHRRSRVTPFNRLKRVTRDRLCDSVGAIEISHQYRQRM